MAIPDKAKPATALHGEPVSIVEQLRGRLDSTITPSPINLQVARLTKLYAINAAMAETLAPLVFAEALQ
jgi:hypothetical protein